MWSFMDEMPLTPKRSANPMKLFRAVSLIAVLSLVFTSAYLYTGVIPESGQSIRQATDPVRFNFEIGAMMVITAGSIGYWYILVLRILRERREKQLSTNKGK